jgi:hypothetical protein
VQSKLAKVIANLWSFWLKDQCFSYKCECSIAKSVGSAIYLRSVFTPGAAGGETLFEAQEIEGEMLDV